MNANHIATMGAAGVSGASVGIVCWLIGLAGVDVPAPVHGYMVTLATALGGYYFHKPAVPQNPTQGQA